MTAGLRFESRLGVLRVACPFFLHANAECERLIGYPEDSDSENEEGVLEKLAGAIGHLFTGWSLHGRRTWLPGLYRQSRLVLDEPDDLARVAPWQAEITVFFSQPQGAPKPPILTGPPRRSGF
ncbi:unnamed protein product [Timema podura]|uniref:Uncharacterized protein n=1 Tax=Timema podura TaxID=61482 RepID=A0ABN7P972_TIMPD|nr:unnamed protein product [Timema podura]